MIIYSFLYMIVRVKKLTAIQDNRIIIVAEEPRRFIVMNVIELATTLVQPKPEASQLLLMLKDKSLPLEERWTAYKIACDGGVISRFDSYGDGFLSLIKNDKGRPCTPYDDFYIERYQSMMYAEFMEEYFLDDLEEGEEEGLPEGLSDWQEAVLASGTKGFTYDW